MHANLSPIEPISEKTFKESLNAGKKTKVVLSLSGGSNFDSPVNSNERYGSGKDSELLR